MKTLFALLLLTASFITWSFEAAINGTPNASVYLAEPSLPAEKKAAEELISYIEKMSGVKLPLSAKLPEDGNRIVIGNTEEVQKLLKNINLKTLKPDEIVIYSPDANTLVLSGSKPRGTLYAVYTLLEKLGVRFWSPEYEFIPQKRQITIPTIMIRYAPPFDFRQSFSESSQKNRIWSAKLKLNGDLWLPKIPEAYGGSRRMDMRQSLTNDYVKPKEFFKTHPEWYAWRKKEKARVPKQLCMTNHEALDQLVKEVRRDLKTEPGREFISVALPDNNICCECKTCTELVKKEEALSALSIYAANYVAKAINGEYPDVKVMILAYWPTERPPKAMKMEANTGVVFAMLDRNHGLPPAATARHNPFLKKWKQLSHGNVYIWDYYATFGNFLLPMPNLYVMQSAFRTYRDQQVKGVFAQLPFGSIAEFEELRTYLLGKLCWDPDLNSKALIAEYLDGVCGKAAAYVQQYIDLLENAKNRKRGTWIGVYSEKTDHWLKASDILKGRDLFLKAMEATADAPDVQRRVRRLSATVTLVSILRYRDIAEEAGKQKRQIPTYAAMVDELEAIGKEFKCSTYKEWAPFDKLIERLRKNPPETKQRKMQHQAARILDAKHLRGNGLQRMKSDEESFVRLSVNSEELGYPWMTPEKGCIVYEIPETLAGCWDVMLDIRAGATEDQQKDVAYLGIYTPTEICRQVFSVSPGDTAWQTICLGKWELPARSKIWVMPGVTAPSRFIDVKKITLLPATSL